MQTIRLEKWTLLAPLVGLTVCSVGAVANEFSRCVFVWYRTKLGISATYNVNLT